LWQIAAKLNEAGYRTRRGKEFQATTVQRLLPPLHRVPSLIPITRDS